MVFEISENVTDILHMLKAEGYEAYAVGGCVRDRLLGDEPKDWDITTSATPQQVKALFQRTVDTGIKHGTITVLYGGGSYEVTTYRIDGKYEDSRHPKDVTFTSDLKEDLLRRDFTINAMAYDPEIGLVDCFDGLKDLKDGVVRCVGEPEARFGEDALRILRAYRFAARYGFRIDGATREAAKKLAYKLKDISAERIRDEVTKILLSGDPSMLAVMDADGVFGQAVPGLAGFAESHKGRAALNGIKRALESTELSGRDRTAFAFGVLLGMAGGAEPGDFTREIMCGLHFDNDTIRTAAGLAAELETPPAADEEWTRRMLARLGERKFRLWLAFVNGSGIKEYRDGSEVAALADTILLRGDCLSLKELALTGSDLVNLGAKEGVSVGRCLNRLLDSVLSDPALNTREELMKLAGEYLTNEEQS